LALKGKGKFHEPVKGRVMLYIPADVHKDSTFPFKTKEEVEIEIVSSKLVVKKLKR